MKEVTELERKIVEQERKNEVISAYSKCLKLFVGQSDTFEMRDELNYGSLRKRLSLLKDSTGIDCRSKGYPVKNSNKFLVTVTRVDDEVIS